MSEQKTWHMWSPGDELPESTPKNCEMFSFPYRVWKATILRVDDWERSYYRWPAEPVKQEKQRPTAFGLLSEEEQEELKEAHYRGAGLDWFIDGTWVDCPSPGYYVNVIYRIKEPQTPEPSFKITMDNVEIDPKSFSKEGWANLRGEG
jgi:hypothetical protein